MRVCVFGEDGEEPVVESELLEHVLDQGDETYGQVKECTSGNSKDLPNQQLLKAHYPAASLNQTRAKNQGVTGRGR